MGSHKQILYDIKSYEGVNLTIEEITDIIIKKRKDLNNNQVYYTFINFECMMRKI